MYVLYLTKFQLYVLPIQFLTTNEVVRREVSRGMGRIGVEAAMLAEGPCP